MNFFDEFRFSGKSFFRLSSLESILLEVKAFFILDLELSLTNGNKLSFLAESLLNIDLLLLLYNIV
jgi:hypothetical protein